MSYCKKRTPKFWSKRYWSFMHKYMLMKTGTKRAFHNKRHFSNLTTPRPPGYGHCGDQVNPESRLGESAQGESRLVWLVSYARWYKAQSLYTKQRFAKGVQRNITDFLKASITTDSIKIFSITFCTLVTVYCTCKIAKDAFRIVLYVTTFYMQHCAVARFVLKQ